METKLDHLVIGAGDLSQGVEYVKERLGVEMPYGGEHKKMGTHNHLMQLGKNIFLEVISINPNANRPNRLRWYGLDDPFVRQTISYRPQLISWVVNTDNIHQLMEQTTFPFGVPEMISRGNLNWHFGLPADGRLLAGGTIPYLMQWKTDVHPCTNMLNLGCTFKRLDIYHPNANWLKAVLEQIQALQFVHIHRLDKNQTAYMMASIETPSGVKELSSRV